MNSPSHAAAALFNNMADDYDDLRSLWYSWLYARLHLFIVNQVLTPAAPSEVLDVGCGTGQQSFLYAAAGCHVRGIDLADRLLEKAIAKLQTSDNMSLVPLPEHHKFLKQYNTATIDRLLTGSTRKSYTPPEFAHADACHIPFDDCQFDHINCCGSVLSFIEDHNLALKEMHRVLKPGGTLFLETEARWNLDLLWTTFEWLLRIGPGFNPSAEEVKRLLLSPKNSPCWIDYPYGEKDHPVTMRLKLFSVKGLVDDIEAKGFKVKRKWSVHSLTNVFPSIVLFQPAPSNWIRFIFGIMARIEETAPVRLPGCSIVVLSTKL